MHTLISLAVTSQGWWKGGHVQQAGLLVSKQQPTSETVLDDYASLCSCVCLFVCVKEIDPEPSCMLKGQYIVY